MHRPYGTASVTTNALECRKGDAVGCMLHAERTCILRPFSETADAGW
jgi:hypothetical protein